MQIVRQDLDTIRTRVAAAIQAVRPGIDVAEIDIEADSDDQGTEFLRVVLHLGDAASDADLEAVLEEIERSVGEIDPRYPSVRFADAASWSNTIRV